MPICFSAIGCQHSAFNRLFGCVFLVWRHHLRDVNKSSVRILDAFSAIFLSFGVPQYSNRLDYIKACDQQFTLTTKKSLHITFNSVNQAVVVVASSVSAFMQLLDRRLRVILKRARKASGSCGKVFSCLEASGCHHEAIIVSMKNVSAVSIWTLPGSF